MPTRVQTTFAAGRACLGAANVLTSVQPPPLPALEVINVTKRGGLPAKMSLQPSQSLPANVKSLLQPR